MTTQTTEYTPTVGDIFESSWGYDQTNIDYYEIVSISKSGKSVKVKAIASRRLEGDRYTDKVVPAPGVDASVNVHIEPGTTVTKFIKNGYRGQPYFKVADYANAYLWEGAARHETALGAGH